MNLVTTEILKTNEVKPGYFLHDYNAPLMAKTSEPGQFIHVRVAAGPHPILRRPFSICSAKEDRLQILFRVVGEGTHLLSKVMPGEKIDIMGPIGTPFKIEHKPAVLIAGGIGCAPLYFLALRMKEANIPVRFYYGARSVSDLPLHEEINAIAGELNITTEDGSLGKKGLITDVLPDRLTQDFAVYACGPETMLHALKKILDAQGISAQFSLENRMACGVGACMGCVTRTISGFKRVCVDGPVFSSDDVVI
ncbi:dihydroorotate dehydrogenase electron transfer subunit [Candidatus Sumerlaeota bacterium]|nr:dihydroorotate dehydrogenase electron transfer subunit [Candidatus Sumerlaeota bacterium]